MITLMSKPIIHHLDIGGEGGYLTIKTFGTMNEMIKVDYGVRAESLAGRDATIIIKESKIDFGTAAAALDVLPSPADLFLGSFAACILKNVERFSEILKYEYQKATIEVSATRLETPPRMEDIAYMLKIYSDDDNLNVKLIKRNIEKFGTIFNTVKSACTISGQIVKI